MQVGRWTHQSTAASSDVKKRATRDGHTEAASYPVDTDRRRAHRGGRPAGRGPADRPHFGRRFDDRRAPMGGRGFSGGRRGGKRGGFGAFGETEAEIAKFTNRAVVTTEEPVFVPEHKFSDFDISAHLKENIAKKGYELPSPIQDKAIPHGLLGQDVVGLAATGTGKTAAFLIPLVDKVIKQKDERVLVMAPTRELAVQIEKELAGFAKGTGMRGMVAVGGANISPQISQLKHRPSFVIGTPGRLKDLEERRAIHFSDFGTVVLDEADRMLDMGFIDDMRFIIGKMPKERHTLFFSATMSREIEKLIGEFLTNPVVISVKANATAETIDQDVVRVPRGADKFQTLVDLLQNRDFTRVLVFGRTKHGVERLAKDLSRQKIFAESIHGNKTHNARVRALEAFTRGRVNVLVATDVAARGLDIPAVSHVINYDLPSTYEDYVHRIGRTGRAAQKGVALTFVQER